MGGRATRPRGTLAILAALVALLGCTEESVSRVRLHVVVESGIPDRVDRVRVVATAFRTPMGSAPPALCVPVVRERQLRSTADAMFFVDFVLGPTYGQGVGFVVEWFRGADRLSTNALLVPTPGSGQWWVEARLDSACLDHPCADGRRCDVLPAGGAECRSNAVVANLLDPAYWASGESCDPDFDPWTEPDAGIGDTADRSD